MSAPDALGKAPFIVDYRCSKCNAAGLKLWRGVHGCKSKDGHELLCADCLAPGRDVSPIGKAYDEHGLRTDQINGWLPAVPVDDTYWGYTSVPPADVSWWRALPVRHFETDDDKIFHLEGVLEEEQRIAIEFQRCYLDEIKRAALRVGEGSEP